MRSPLVWGLALSVGAMILAPTLRADTLPQPDTGQVRSLVKQLDDPRFPVRQDADRQLRELGIGVVPILRKEMDRRPSLEVHRRLEAIVDELAQIKWRHDLTDALKEAKQSGKPLLVFSSLGKSDGTGSLATQAMVARTFPDLELIHFIAENFVPVWHRQLDDEALESGLSPRFSGVDPSYTPEQLSQYEAGRGVRNLRTFFCTAEGKVFHSLQGFFSASDYLAHSIDARKLLADSRRMPAGLRSELLRTNLRQRSEQLTRGQQGLAGQEAVLAELQAQLLMDNIALLDKPIGPILNGIAGELQRMSHT